MSDVSVDTSEKAGRRPAPERPRLGARLEARPDWAAAGIALAFWAASLTPTLLPRSVSVQGGLTGVLIAIGYGLGGLILRVLRLQRERTGFWFPSDTVRRAARIVVWAVAGVLLTLGTYLWWRSQLSQRAVVQMAPLGARSMVYMVLIAAIVLVIVLFISRLLAALFGRILVWLWRPLGPIFSRLAVSVLVVLVGWLAFDQLIVQGIYASVDATFKAGNDKTTPGVHKPTSTLESGGPGSLTPWDTLGVTGRDFAAGATTTSQLESFWGPTVPVAQPIRVYVGLQTAPTPEARAQLAVKELERTGAFSRAVLVVGTATGTGWINPNAGSAIEYLWKGNTAFVTQQYSYLPSWIAFLTERSTAATAGRDLIAAVVDHWKTLPADHRPRLLLFGESLGSYGAESGLATPQLSTSLAALESHSNGALFVGPTEGNPIWRQIRAGRLASSPVWRPRLSTPVVNAANSSSEVPPMSAAFGAHSIQYLVHGSDPVSWWSMATMWWPPAWITGPTPPGVPSSVTWFPVVTWLQTAADLMAGFSTEPGFGHNYNDSFVQGFASIASPPEWSSADTTRLARHLDYLNQIATQLSNS